MNDTKPFNLMGWIEENRALLKPPVGARTLWSDGTLMITIVGGPNARTDYHIDPFEEFFYQITGDFTLGIQDETGARDITIREGEIYMLPRHVPHAPNRPAGTVGLIVERRRQPDDPLDAHAWYCRQCNHMLFRKDAYIEVLERDMPPIFDAYYADPANQRCDNCGHVNPGRP